MFVRFITLQHRLDGLATISIDLEYASALYMEELIIKFAKKYTKNEILKYRYVELYISIEWFDKHVIFDCYLLR